MRIVAVAAFLFPLSLSLSLISCSSESGVGTGSGGQSATGGATAGTGGRGATGGWAAMPARRSIRERWRWRRWHCQRWCRRQRHRVRRRWWTKRGRRKEPTGRQVAQAVALVGAAGALERAGAETGEGTEPSIPVRPLGWNAGSCRSQATQSPSAPTPRAVVTASSFSVRA